jgi:citrate lyase subunit beta/citryl-CoA lyase
MTWTCLSWAHARAPLFVPADRPDRLQKAYTSGADALIFDLEDAVAPSSKSRARHNLPALVQGAHAAGLPAWVRLNHDVLQLADDLQALVQAQADAFVWPKAEHPGLLDAIDQALNTLGAPHDLGAVALVEHPRTMGHERLMQLAMAPRVKALALGTEDFSAAMGAAPSPALLQAPAQAVIRAARACDVLAYALPCSIALIEDTKAWQDGLQWARAQGGHGALCIHPKQVAAIHACFQASPKELEWAQRVLQMAESHAGAAFRMDGLMVDLPVLERAKRLLHPF